MNINSSCYELNDNKNRPNFFLFFVICNLKSLTYRANVQ